MQFYKQAVLYETSDFSFLAFQNKDSFRTALPGVMPFQNVHC